MRDFWALNRSAKGAAREMSRREFVRLTGSTAASLIVGSHLGISFGSTAAPTLFRSNEQLLTSFEEGESVAVSGPGAYDPTPSPYGGSRSWKVTTIAGIASEVIIDLGTTVDLTGKNMALCIRADGPYSDWNLMQLEVAADRSFTSNKFCNHIFPPLQQVNDDNAEGSWAWLPHPSGAWVDFGSFNLADTRYIKLRFRSLTSKNIWLDQVSIHDNPLHGTNGIVSFRWDDGYSNQYANIPDIFGSRSIRCGVYVAKDWIEQNVGTDMMNAADAAALIAAGYEIGVHGIDSHSDVGGTEKAIATEVRKNRDLVASLGGRSDVYAYPKYVVEGPKSFAALRSLGFKVATNGYGIGGVADIAVPMEPLIARTVELSENSATDHRLNGWVEACKRGAWITLVGHQIDADLRGIGISSKRLVDVVDTFLANAVTVMPVGDVVDTYFTYV